MIIYSVTVTIEAAIEREWLDWMRRVHVPDVLRTGCFTGAAIYKMFEPTSDEQDRKSTRLNSSHMSNSYAVFCVKKKEQQDLGVDGERAGQPDPLPLAAGELDVPALFHAGESDLAGNLGCLLAPLGAAHALAVQA